MTWYANELMCVGTPAALAFVRRHPQLAAHAYHVRPPLEHAWHADEVRHGLPPEGLVVVRPLAARHGDAVEWREGDTLDWSTLAAEPAALRIPPELVMRGQEHAKRSDFPPASALAFMKSMAGTINTPVIYYASTMWGGSVELEYAWVFAGREHVLLRVPVWGIDDESSQLLSIDEAGQGVAREGEVLVEALAALGLALPTRYFALHTRSFPWAAHSMRNIGSQ